MKKPVQIGVTGGIGSGKSLVCAIFKKLGVPVYDADHHAKELMTTDGILVEAIKKEFGPLSYHPDGSLNRAFLAEHVFHDEKKLAKLNALVHPRVKHCFHQWLQDHAKAPYIIKEAALLFEANTTQSLSGVIVVSAPEDLRVQRVTKRDPHRTVEQILAIVEKQLPDEEKVKRADYIIVNDETSLVIPQVLALHQKFSADAN